MKNRLFMISALLALFMGSAIPLAAQRDFSGKIKFLKGAEVIRVQPKQSSYSATIDMAKPSIETGMEAAGSPSTNVWKGTSNSIITMTVGEMLFTVLTHDNESKTGTVQLGATYAIADNASGATDDIKKSYVRHCHAILHSLTNNAYSGYYVTRKVEQEGLWIPNKVIVNSDVTIGGKYAGYTFTVTEIGDSAFSGFYVTDDNTNHPDGVTLYLPSTITHIGKHAFGGSRSSADFYKGGTESCELKAIKFYNADDPTQTDDGHQYSNVTSLGDEAFGYVYLKNFPYLGKLKTMGTNALRRIERLQSVDITMFKNMWGDKLPDGSLYFMRNALETFTIPNYIKKVGNIWHQGTTRATASTVTKIEFEGTEINELDLRVFNLPKITEITVPDCVQKFTHGYDCDESVNLNKVESFTFSSAVGTPTGIPEECFKTCNKLTTIGWGGITTIGQQAFQNCSALTDATIPAQITAIGASAYYRSGVQKIDFSQNSNITAVPAQCFYGCDKIDPAQVNLGSKITTIGSEAFYNCKLTSIDFLKSSNVTVLGEGCFERNKLTSLDDVLGKVTEIGKDAFYMNDITTFTIQPQMTLVGDEAFYGNRIDYVKYLPADDASINANLQMGFGVFNHQKCTLTLDFETENLTEVPAYIKGAPATHSEGERVTDGEGNTISNTLGCLRVIVPMGCVTNYTTNEYMGDISYSDYRVKFKWGAADQFEADGKPKTLTNDMIDNLYNITPQQRLIATAAWKNDILCFRPHIIADGQYKETTLAKRHDFNEAASMAPSIGPRKEVAGDRHNWYSNTVDIWTPEDHTAKPLGWNEDLTEGENLAKFFDAETFPFNEDDFYTNATADEKHDLSNYPQTLMPYTIHTYHMNGGNEQNPEQLGRKPVMDGIVPDGTGIIIDYPKPGYYLVPPAFMPGDTHRKVYTVDRSAPEVLSNGEWEDYKYSETEIDKWVNLKDPKTTTDYVYDQGYMFPPLPTELPEEAVAYFKDLKDQGLDIPTVLKEQGNYSWGASYTDVLESMVEDAHRIGIIADYDNVDATAITTNDYNLENWDSYSYQAMHKIYKDNEVISIVCYDPNNGDLDFYRVNNGEASWANSYSLLTAEFITLAHDNGEELTFPRVIYNLLKQIDDITEDNVNGTATYKGKMYNLVLGDEVEVKMYPIYEFDKSYKVTEITREKINNMEPKKWMNWSAVFWEGLLSSTDDYDTKTWIDLLADHTDKSSLHEHFTANQDPENDHNVIIGVTDPYPLYPYWADSPYPFESASYDVIHHSLSDRFTDAANPTPYTFKWNTYGRMGNGNNFLSITGRSTYAAGETALSQAETKAKLDADGVVYVNFVVSKGYFVQVNAKPADGAFDGTQHTNWMPANRAYFSVSRHHMPHVFDNAAANGKLSLFIIDNDETTSIRSIDNNEGNTVTTRDNHWYSLQGVRLNSKPTTKGIYVHGGKKVIIK